MKNVYKLLMLSVLLLASPYALAEEPLFTRYTFYGISSSSQEKILQNLLEIA